MFNKLRNRKSNKKGFTLIELIIVIAILGILAAILVPSMLNIVNNSKTSVATANARSVYSVAQSAYVKLNINNDTAGTPAVAAGDYASTSTSEFMNEINDNLGAAFDDAFTVTVGASGVSSVEYNGVTYSPTATS